MSGRQGWLVGALPDQEELALAAAFCKTYRPTTWQILAAAHKRLRSLIRHREDLLQTQVRQQNRLRHMTDTLVRDSLQVALATLAKQRPFDL